MFFPVVDISNFCGHIFGRAQRLLLPYSYNIHKYGLAAQLYWQYNASLAMAYLRILVYCDWTLSVAVWACINSFRSFNIAGVRLHIAWCNWLGSPNVEKGLNTWQS